MITMSSSNRYYGEDTSSFSSSTFSLSKSGTHSPSKSMLSMGRQISLPPNSPIDSPAWPSDVRSGFVGPISHWSVKIDTRIMREAAIVITAHSTDLIVTIMVHMVAVLDFFVSLKKCYQAV